MFENAFHPISPSCHSSSLLSADPRLCKSPSKPFIRDFSRNAIAIGPLQMPMPLSQFLGTPFNLSHLGLHPPHHIRERFPWQASFCTFFHLFPVACHIFTCLHVQKEVALKTGSRCEVQRRSIIDQ